MASDESRPERNKSSPAHLVKFVQLKSKEAKEKGEGASMPASQSWRERNRVANAKLLSFLRANPKKIGEASRHLRIGQDTVKERIRHNGHSRDIEGILQVEGYLRTVGEMPTLPRDVSITGSLIRGISESKVTSLDVSEQLGVETSAIRIWLSTGRVSANWIRSTQLEWLLREKGVIRSTSVDTLHPSVRRVFILVYQGKVSVDEICETLSVKRDSVIRYLTNRSQPGTRVAKQFAQIADAHEKSGNGGKESIEPIPLPQPTPETPSVILNPAMLSDDDLISTILLGVRLTVAGLTYFLKKGRSKQLTQQRLEIARLMARDQQAFFDLQNVVDAFGGSGALEKWRKESL